METVVLLTLITSCSCVLEIVPTLVYSPSASVLPFPGPRFMATGSVSNNTLWMYGGLLSESLPYSDLWLFSESSFRYQGRFSESLSQERGNCYGDPQYLPPSLWAAFSWIVGSNFYIFGGLN
jgi:hypothetical protein